MGVDDGSNEAEANGSESEASAGWQERVERLLDEFESEPSVRRFLRRATSESGPEFESLLTVLEKSLGEKSPSIGFELPEGLVEALTDVALSGEWTLDRLRQSTRSMLSVRDLPGGLDRLVEALYRSFSLHPHWRREAVVRRWLVGHPELFASVLRARLDRPRWLTGLESPTRGLHRPAMNPGLRPWSVPPIDDLGELVRLLETCGVDGPSRLLTLMDPCSIQEAPGARSGRYHRYWRGRRLIEAPGPMLKKVQQAIAMRILRAVPAHDAAHGFCADRGVLTAVKPHAGRDLVLVVDLEAFFPSIHAARVHGLFQSLGYPEVVARALTDLCTTRSRTLPARRDGSEVTLVERERYSRRHLPAGAPSSPDLANRIAYRLDCRLEGFARACGARYTRYADDLVFSAETGLAVKRFLQGVARIVSSEGFTIHSRKTRVMTRSDQQRVLGLVLNDRPRIPRKEYESLEAWLFNLSRLGVETQDREGRADLRQHLTGRVAWVRQVEPERAERLESLLEAVDW